MKLVISLCVFALFILNSQPGFSQKEIEISGKKYMVHRVKKKETLYSLSMRYKVTPDELKQANPGMDAGLKLGSRINIPVKKEVTKMKAESSLVVPMADEPEYYYHKVMKGQNIFSISRQYGLTDNELIRINPDIANGLATGKVLKIPVKGVDSNNSSVQHDSSGDAPNSARQDTRTALGYMTHTVARGETIYSLGKIYGVSREELIRLNPSIENGLQIGANLKIQQKNAPQSTTQERPDLSLEKYKVEKGETLFSLASRFGLHVSDMKKANPSLYSRSLETGEIILIPKQGSPVSDFQVEVSATDRIAKAFRDAERGKCNPITGNKDHKYTVGLLLPLYLQGNDHINASDLNEDALLNKLDFSQVINHQLSTSITDTVPVVTKEINIDQRAESFIEFYEGALLAMDSLHQMGMNIELCVFDASNLNMINGLLQLDVFRELDLIIGPVYPELQPAVASFAAKNKIPMVSPLASTGNFEQNNPYYFKVNPTKEYQLEQTAQYIAGEFKNKNFVMLPMNGNSNTTEAKLAELSKQKLFTARQINPNGKNLFHEYNFQKQGLHSLKTLMDETGENVFMIPSDNEAQVSVAVTNLNSLAESFNIVLIGTSHLTKMKSIQTENYHHVRLRYMSPTFVDYTKPLVRRFVNLNRETFSGEPSQFSHQGYDVTYYFLSALYRYGKDFKDCLQEYPMELTQTNFNFRRVTPMGGFMNQSMFVTSYERNYDILNYGALVPDSK